VDLLSLIAAVLAGGAILLIVLGTTGARSEPAAERLQQYSAGSFAAQAAAQAPQTAERASLGQAITQSATMNALNRAVERRTWSEGVARELARADLTLRPVEYIGLRLGVILAAVGITWLLGVALFETLSSPLFLLAAAAIGFFIPNYWINRRKARRLRAFNDGLADTIALIANALRSGSSFLQSIDLVVRERQPPISTEFNRVIREVNLGLSLETALANMVRRVRSDDLELLTTAIAIQHSAGGNLAEILDTISFTIRERVRIKGEIRTLTAQQRLSGYVVGFLPIALVVIISVISPRFIQPMFEKPPELFDIPLGYYLFGIGGILMLIGFAAIRRIVDIEV
jgi:tight adherence protein B